MRVTIDAPEVIIVRSGTLSIPVRVELEDGSPATGYTFDSFAACDDGTPTSACTVTAPTVGNGSEMLLATGRRPGNASLVAKAIRSDGSMVQSEEHRLLFLDGFPVGIQAATTDARMAPGERRPFAGVVYEMSATLPTVPTYSTMDPAVATVDAQGVVTAVAPGTTSLVLASGSLSTSVPLVVDTGRTIGPPPEGAFSLRSPKSQTTKIGTRAAAANPEHGLVIDSRGYPHAVVKFGPRTMVASWSGTDVGTELLPDDIDGNARAFIAIDERDRLYVFTISGLGAFVYEKQASDPPSAWKVRPLDTHDAGADAAGLLWVRYFAGSHVSASLLPRAGGGMQVVFRVDLDTRAGEYSTGCGAVYRFADVGDATIATTDITSDWVPSAPTGCAHDFLKLPQQFALVRGTGGATTFVLPFGNHLYGSLENRNMGLDTFTRSSNGQWSRTPPVPNGSTISPRYLKVLHDEHGAPSKILSDEAGVGADNLYLFDDSGRTYIGYGFLNGIGATWVAQDNPEDIAMLMSVEGLATRAGHVHFLASMPEPDVVGLVVLHRFLAPPDPRATDPEANGRLATGTVGSASAFVPRAVLADGTRFGVGPDLAATLQRSDATDAPWSAAGGGVALDPVAPVATSGAALYVFDDTTRLRSSTDRGTSLQVVTDPAPRLPRNAQRMVASAGKGAVLLFDDELIVTAFHTNGTPSPWLRVPIAPVTSDGRVLRLDPGQRGVFVLADGFAFVAATGFASTAERVVVLEYGWDGALRATRQHANPVGVAFDALYVGDGAQAPGGALVFFSHRSAQDGPRARTHRLDLVSGAWTTADLAESTLQPSNVIALDGGGFLMGGSIDPRSLAPGAMGGVYHRRHAVVWKSADGLVWGAPKLLRPHGGDTQFVRRVLDDHAGAALVLVDDTFKMNPSPFDPVPLVQHTALP